ncbi:MAG: glycosyltransferase family 4 protein [Acidobacteria bacterium]|nr:glycosyltransferase family 4 protein [Acidobacteriota bacterium]
MKVGLIASPFIPVPPVRYGGTELFLATLAEALQRLGHDVTVYANAESRVRCRLRSMYERSDWPITDAGRAQLKDLNHTAHACADVEQRCDVVHVNNTQSLAFSRFSRRPFVCTIHHPHDDVLSEFYAWYPDVRYVAISRFQARQEHLPHLTAIHHGLDVTRYQLVERKESYLTFLGRIAPVKGAHLAIQIARESGIPLKLAGEIQPAHAGYWESEVKPYVDGRFIEYVGEADLATKNELLGRSIALLFPIQWNEPFGLIMLEAMACGTPVVALAGGAVEEVVENGLSGWICRDLDAMVARVRDPGIEARRCREYVQRRFSAERMARRYVAVYEQAVAARRQPPSRSATTVELEKDRVRPQRTRDEDRVELSTM